MPAIDADAMKALKFSDCLSRELAQHLLQSRATDAVLRRTVIKEPVRFVTAMP